MSLDIKRRLAGKRLLPAGEAFESRKKLKKRTLSIPITKSVMSS